MSSQPKDFDAVAIVRQIRDRISAQIAGMTLQEQLEWMASQELRDPFLKRLRDKAAQRSDATDDAAGRH